MANAAMRAVWRRLPVGFRRTLAHSTLSLLAPGLPSATAATNAPWIVVGFLTSPSGLGQAARLGYAALERQGHQVFGIDLSGSFMELAGRVPFPFHDGRKHRGPAHVLVNINAPYMKYVFQLLGRGFLREKEIVAYWAWELPSAPESWREGFDRTHRILTPSAFVAEALRLVRTDRPIAVAPHPVALEALPILPKRVEPISANAPFVIASVLNAASGFERKNPLALIGAYRKAFGGAPHVRLQVLVSNAEHYEGGAAKLRRAAAGDATISLTFDTLDRAGYWRWFGAPDLYAALHRAEGFGLPIAEAMCMGVPVLATHWSANAEFMTEENSLPVSYTMTPVQDPQKKYESGPGNSWAEANQDHAAALMARAVNEPHWLADRADAGQETARRLFSTFNASQNDAPSQIA